MAGDPGRERKQMRQYEKYTNKPIRDASRVPIPKQNSRKSDFDENIGEWPSGEGRIAGAMANHVKRHEARI